MPGLRVSVISKVEYDGRDNPPGGQQSADPAL